MNNIEKQLADFKAEQDKRFEEFKASITHKVEFEVGKWYMYPNDKGMLCYTGKEYTFGFWNDFQMKWSDSILFKGCYSPERPATESEIKEALIKEAEKRGFKRGVKAELNGKKWEQGRDDFNYYGRQDDIYPDSLQSGGIVCYQQGKWATIVKEPKLTFGGYEVKIEKGVNHRAVITCQNIKGTYDQLKKIYDWFVNPSPLTFGSKKLEQFNLDGIEYQMVSDVPSKVKIGCTWGTMEEIKSILEACEKLS